MVGDADFIPERGFMSALVRNKDWTKTALGPIEAWPASLRTVLRLMLTSRYAMWMGWGSDLTFFYNDAYAAQTLGAKHPWALGRPAREVWAEIWTTVGPRIQHVLETGEATWDEGLMLFLERSGYAEETYHTFSYSPAPGDGARDTAGLFCVVIEETERVLGARRIALLREFAALLGQTNSESDVFRAVERCLVADARDIPFSLTYLFDADGKRARRVSETGFGQAHEYAPAIIDGEGLWPLPTENSVVVPLPATHAWPTGPWQRFPSHALVVPIGQQGQAMPVGVFIAGLNPHRPVDESLESFVDLFVGQLAASLSNARAYEFERKRAEMLTEIDRAKTAFFSNVSHEFRTPLTLMIGPTEDALASSERALHGQALETVHRNELRLLKLVNTLLDFARIEAGRVQAAYEPTDLAALTVDLASSFRSAIDRAGLRFDVSCEKLPEPFYVDHDMWEKIVLNLLSNALKFTFDGSISVAMSLQNERAQLVVRDTGVGIAEHELPRLFERFHRIEGTRARTHEGSGIGLALVNELVRLHGGTIEVASTPSKGTTFTVSIPSGRSHLPAERVGSRQRRSSQSSAGAAYVEEALRWLPDEITPPAELVARPGTRILVADDNADMRDYLTRILRQHWTVTSVADGQAALEVARREHPDLVLSDVMMPRLDGFGLVRELRSDPATAATPVMLLSARAGEEATAEGLRTGADDYLVKPFSAGALLVRIESLLSAARLRQTLQRTTELERERLKMMFDESPGLFAIVRGPNLVIELANPLVLQVWGKGSEVVGKPLLEVLPELREQTLGGQSFAEVFRGVLEDGVPYHGEAAQVSLTHRDGARNYFFNFSYIPLRDHDDDTSGVFIYAHDVTAEVLARRQVEEAKAATERALLAEKEARQDAEAANRLKDEFLATMSHELRTPLNAILGWALLLGRGNLDRASLERGLSTIERNARAQARLIEDVLDVSRIISGKLRLDMRKLDVNGVARAALDVIRPAAEAKGVHLLEELAEDGAQLIADSDRLQQVIWNLLSNAVKFTPADGAVKLCVERRESSVRIVVTDTGVGIPSESLPFIFERFRQADNSTTRKYGGLGLGLAIVRHLVDLHGGTVSAESAGPGRGAEFTVILPIRALNEIERSERRSPTPENPRPAYDPALELAGLSVLVVDDDQDSRALVEAVLMRAGASVASASSAAEAFAAVTTHRYDLLVSDIGMPEEDGLSLMRRIRALPETRGNVPAIALTAYARSDDAARALAAGYQKYLAKPADVDALLKAAVSLTVRAVATPD